MATHQKLYLVLGLVGAFCATLAALIHDRAVPLPADVEPYLPFVMLTLLAIAATLEPFQKAVPISADPAPAAPPPTTPAGPSSP